MILSPYLRRTYRTQILAFVLSTVSTEASVVSAVAAASESIEIVRSSEAGWPQFRGPRRDGISDERGLLQSWPETGLKQVWSVGNLGRGFSSPVIADGRLFITGDSGDTLRIYAFDLHGKPLWQSSNGSVWSEQYPGSRSSATFSAGCLYHQNSHGRVACFDAKNGKELWAVDLLERFKGENITWGLSECLLVDDRAVYATAGGREALCVALDKKTGKLLWKSEPLLDSEGERSVESPSYTSPILVSFGGRRLLIGCSLRHLFCVDADTGRIQWTHRMPTTYNVLAMMPAVVENGIFNTAPYGKGGHLFRLLPPASPGAQIGKEEVWTTRLDTLQGCVVSVNGKLLGAFYPGRKGWAAVDAKTGGILYTAPEITKGAGLWADGRLYTLCEDGWMLLLDPTDTKFEVKGRFRLTESSVRDAWAHPVVHDKRLYLRYHDTLHCYDIRAEQ